MPNIIEFKMDMKSEALVSLERLTFIGTEKGKTKYYKDISGASISSRVIGAQVMEMGEPTLSREVRLSYRKAWDGQGLDARQGVVNNVYRAVKSVMLGHSKLGELTGSTWNAISTWIEGDALHGGIREGTWPSQPSWPAIGPIAPSVSYAPLINVLRVIKEKNIWKSSMSGMPQSALDSLLRETEGMIGGRQIAADYNKAVRSRRSARLKSVKANVELKWDISGLKIQWPDIAKKRLGLSDRFIPSEPFDTKKYGKGQGRQKKFFAISDEFANKVALPVLDEYVEALWDAGRKPKPEGRGGEPSGVVTQKLQEIEMFEGEPRWKTKMYEEAVSRDAAIEISKRPGVTDEEAVKESSREWTTRFAQSAFPTDKVAAIVESGASRAIELARLIAQQKVEDLADAGQFPSQKEKAKILRAAYKMAKGQ